MLQSSTNTVRVTFKFTTLLFSTSIAAMFLYWFSAGIATSQAADTQAALPTPKHSIQISVLDGKSFAGELGLIGEPASSTDLLEFNNGRFISRECEKRCGYTDGIYWVRSLDDGIEVMSETLCLRSDATIVWRGTVRGDKIEGTFLWTSKRWYWTIQKEFWFNGKLVGTVASTSE